MTYGISNKRIIRISTAKITVELFCVRIPLYHNSDYPSSKRTPRVLHYSLIIYYSTSSVLCPPVLLFQVRYNH